MLYRKIERLFLIVLLLSSMGAVDALTRPYLGARDPNIISTDVPRATLVVETVIYLWGALLIWNRRRRVMVSVRMVWPLFAFVALAPISTAWSIEPSLTLRRGILLLASTVVAIYLGERYSVETLARVLTQALCAMMLLTIVSLI